MAQAGLVLALAFLAAGMQSQRGAKWMFYNPYDGPAPASGESHSTPSRLAPINWSGTPTGYQHVGIHYWFQDDDENTYSEAQASRMTVPLSLHIRGNVRARITVWTQDKQLTPMDGQYSGHRLGAGEEYVVPEKLVFTAGESPTRIVIVFGRSQTEQAGDPKHARQRLEDLTTRKARDGALQVIREADELTPNQVGTYVVSREGSPLAAEVVLRLKQREWPH